MSFTERLEQSLLLATAFGMIACGVGAPGEVSLRSQFDNFRTSVVARL
jgi:hypothetical protein